MTFLIASMVMFMGLAAFLFWRIAAWSQADLITTKTLEQSLRLSSDDDLDTPAFVALAITETAEQLRIRQIKTIALLLVALPLILGVLSVGVLQSSSDTQALDGVIGVGVALETLLALALARTLRQKVSW